MNISVIEQNVKNALDNAAGEKDEYLYVSHIRANTIPTSAQIEYEKYFKTKNIDNKIEIKELKNNSNWTYEIIFYIKNPYFNVTNYFGEF